MKALSTKQAQACENALHPRCRCRCGGALHGARRAGREIPNRAWFESLPPDDPHHLEPDDPEEDECETQEVTQLALPLLF